jgi:hypothetical protein
MVRECRGQWSYQTLLIRLWFGRLRPPMEMGMRMNDLMRCLQPEAPLRLYRLPFVYVVEVPIGPGLIGQRPQPLGRLPCGRIQGQDMPMHLCWYMNLGPDMPGRTVDHDNHLLPRPGTDRLGKLRQSTRECGN